MVIKHTFVVEDEIKTVSEEGQCDDSHIKQERLL